MDSYPSPSGCHPLDVCLGGGFHPLYVAKEVLPNPGTSIDVSPRLWIPPPGILPLNRETSPAGATVGLERGREVVKGRPKVMDEVSEKDRQAWLGLLADVPPNPPDTRVRLGLGISECNAWVVCGEPGDRVLNGLQVLHARASLRQCGAVSSPMLYLGGSCRRSRRNPGSLGSNR